MRFGSAIKDKPFGESYSGESSDYLRTFKEGQSLVRFVYPLSADGWIGYYEHYNPTTKRSTPCLRDSNGDTSECGACNSDNKDFRYAGRKVATNIMLVDKEIVLPFKMSQRLFEQIERRAERDGGDVTKRDYLITRSGKGTNTTYDVDREDSYEIDLKAAQTNGYDIQKILAGQFEEYWENYGDSVIAEKVTEKPVKEELEKPDF